MKRDIGSGPIAAKAVSTRSCRPAGTAKFREDGQIVHLHGLNLSRAAALAAMARTLTDSALLKSARELYGASADRAVTLQRGALAADLCVDGGHRDRRGGSGDQIGPETRCGLQIRRGALR